jgi:heme/copper-type cytochrome/quinol oxidase subunit 2
MSENLQNTVLWAASIMLGIGILCATIMVVASKKKNAGTETARPYPIQGREVVQVTAIAVIIYAIVVLGVTGMFIDNPALVGLFGSIAGFVLGSESSSRNS